MRPLTLHVSALSDAEYDLYIASLNDLAADTADGTSSVLNTAHSRDDTRHEQTIVGVREARAWLRGRYSDLPASDIDAILKFFCPNMAPSDTLTGGQFFAAFRLVLHAKAGKGADRALAFIQPSTGTSKVSAVTQSPSSPRRPVQAPPSHPDRQKPLPPTISSSPEMNPFTRTSTEAATVTAPPVDPNSVAVNSQQRSSKKVSHNPFLVRDKSDVGVDKPGPAATVPGHGRLPPLPPRKPILPVASSRRPSETCPAPIVSASGPPLIPVKPTHVMSPLMRQSLEASKHAQSLKRAEEQLDRERVLQVLKTTSSNSSISDNSPSMRTRSLSPSKQAPKVPKVPGSGSDDVTCVPPLPRRRKPSLPSSASSSILSLEQVAGATLPVPPAPHFRPPLRARDTPTFGASTDRLGLPTIPSPTPMPPPMHPHRRPSTSTEPNVDDCQSSSSSSARVVRSKSVTASSTAVPPPPPRRKRPGSMQLTPTSDAGVIPAFPPAQAVHARTASYHGLSRHFSLSREREREPTDSSPITNIHKTLTNLQLKAQPKLEAVRYKAEAGISKRGYVHRAQPDAYRWRDEGEQGLMADTRWTAANVDRESDSEPTTDDEPSPAEGTRRSATSDAPSRDLLTESDNLKWPMGGGWKPL